MKDAKRSFTQGQIESIAKILGETNSGLKGQEIANLLSSVGIVDTDPNNTKWKRLYNAFIEVHNKKQTDNHIMSFIAKALEPARFTGDLIRYKTMLSSLNIILSFQGLEFREDGKFHKVKKTTSLSEAEERVSLLKNVVQVRGLHPQLLSYCRAELLENNYFHAVLEAVKGIASMVREKTGLTTDGVKLIDSAFGGPSPLLLINNYSDDTEISEQKGFVNLLKGLFGTFRNPTAHSPRIEWEMEEQDALDLFTMASYAFRRVDNSLKNTNNYI